MTRIERIAIVFTPTVRDGITVACIFVTLFAVILIPHLLNQRLADKAQAQIHAHTGRR